MDSTEWEQLRQKHTLYWAVPVTQPAPGEEQNSQGAETSRVASADPNNSHIRALPAPDATVFSHLQSFATDIHKTLLCKQLTLEHRLQKIQYNPHLTA